MRRTSGAKYWSECTNTNRAAYLVGGARNAMRARVCVPARAHACKPQVRMRACARAHFEGQGQGLKSVHLVEVSTEDVLEKLEKHNNKPPGGLRSVAVGSLAAIDGTVRVRIADY